MSGKGDDVGDVDAIGHEYYWSSLFRALPVRWMSPECIETRQFTEASDVWAFGVLMMEVYSDGMLPYKGANIHTNTQTAT